MTQQATEEKMKKHPVSTARLKYKIYDFFFNWIKRVSSPHRISLRILKASSMGVVMPVMVPIILPRPKLMSMKKNMTDQKGLAGKCVMASVKAMNARPVP